jgi:hypothetical protein
VKFASLHDAQKATKPETAISGGPTLDLWASLSEHE